MKSPGLRCLNAFFVLGVFIALFMPVPQAVATIYSWQDEYGNTHFGDRKVSGVNQIKVELDIKPSVWKPFEIEIEDVGSVLTASERLRISDDVNSVYRFFDHKLYFHLYKTVPVKIRLYKDFESYLEYVNTITSIGSGTRGIYVRKSNEIIVYLQRLRERTFWTIKHETSHAIVDSLMPFLPAWLDEGIAENMETITGDSGALLLHPHNENYQLMKQHHLTNDFLDVADFMAMNSNVWRERNMDTDAVMQVQSGELVRLLLSSSTGLGFVTRLVHHYKRGDRTYSAYLADEHYIGGLDTLRSKWNAWKKRQNNKSIGF